MDLAVTRQTVISGEFTAAEWSTKMCFLKRFKATVTEH